MPVRTEPSAPPSPEGELAGQWIGRIIDERYRIVEVLGEGGMGAVFVAEHLKLRKLVALKTIRTEFAGDGQAEARFSREALATAQIDHPHVVSAMDYGHLPDGGAYLVIQLVRGETLASRLERGAMHWRQAADLAAQIADALATCHAVGIIHRDLKPDNILLEQRRDGALHARVVDFGIARVSGEHGGTIADMAQPLTRMGAVIGTPGYMAPEQGIGQEVDFRADLYALGVILWESFTGQALWLGDSLTELLGRQLSRPAPSLRGDVPDALAEVVDRLLARTAPERPASALEVRDALRRLALSDEFAGSVAPAVSGSAAIPTVHTPGEVTAADIRPISTIPTGAPLASGARSQVSPPPSRRKLWLGGAAAALALGLFGLYGGGGDAKPEASTGEANEASEASAAKDAPAPAKRPRQTLDELVAEAPPAYADDVKMLLSSRHLAARKVASESIARVPQRAELPGYLRDIARLELARDCDDKQAALARLDQADELRALSALKIIASAESECLGDDLARVIARFETEL